MNLKIEYNGKDITSMVDLKSCTLTDRYGGLLDSIRLTINDSDKNWSDYGVSKGDELVITTDEFTTGTMYLAMFDCRDEIAIIDAVSLKPSNRKIKSRLWENVRLMEVLTDCAKNQGLELKTYGITDFTYESLSQIQKTDLDFVSMVCMREGYSVKVDNGCLVVFNEKYMEGQEPQTTIKIDDVDNNYSFVQSSNCVNSVTVTCYDIDKGLIERTAYDNEIIGETKTIIEKVSSYDEAERFAYGYLRNFNKKYVIWYLTIPYNPTISAGTVFDTEGFNEFDDKYVVIEVTHNVKSELTSIVARKVLKY